MCLVQSGRQSHVDVCLGQSGRQSHGDVCLGQSGRQSHVDVCLGQSGHQSHEQSLHFFTVCNILRGPQADSIRCPMNWSGRQFLIFNFFTYDSFFS